MFIVLEGIDGSGKATQTSMLHRALVDERKPVAPPIMFPRYTQTFSGGRLKSFLCGNYGKLRENHPFLVSLLFALDRYESRDLIHACKHCPGYHISDRYIYSNIAHQGAAIRDEAERQDVIAAIGYVEFDIFKQPHADLVILLDIPPELAASRMVGISHDIQEADLEYQTAVRAIYLEMANALPSWHVVSCADAEGSRTVEEIHEVIRRIVLNQILGFKEDMTHAEPARA